MSCGYRRVSKGLGSHSVPPTPIAQYVAETHIPSCALYRHLVRYLSGPAVDTDGGVVILSDAPDLLLPGTENVAFVSGRVAHGV